jgi:hypothetical protein
MYKRITHNIIEEHYDHPMVIPGNVKTKTTKIAYNPALTPIQAESVAKWAEFSWRVRQFINSTFINPSDADYMKTRVFSDIQDLGQTFIKYFNVDDANRFVELLTAMTNTLMDIVFKINTKKDTAPDIAKLRNNVRQLSEFLSSKSSHWPAGTVENILNQVLDLYILQAEYLEKNERIQADSAGNRAYRIIAVNQENGDLSFADIFSTGLSTII